MKEQKTKGTRWRRKKDSKGQELNSKGEYILVFCPFCNHQAHYDTDYGGEYVLFDYCPFCGKKMKK